MFDSIDLANMDYRDRMRAKRQRQKQLILPIVALVVGTVGVILAIVALVQ